ncbi:ligase-associated DNA damage response exonuclease [Fulvivirgaceae bacterium PWU5]|uniref:Ligase-associated DNA damage response exonuclease n=1 Tax=Dawidia cretensis TaxID=2782350 RepID=A0AAP2DW14_9BACT|nr:ligase-associated DNA damage response exonuclease [Dawidia cretensis]MBT1708650.1 ligase-associated DNA damage response exonuclease [Dawidia cretensis]
MPLLEFTDRGIYCPPAGVYLDPWKPVDRALITHGHADHARPGHTHYLCTESAAPVIRYRLRLENNLQTVRYGEPVVINGVHFTFHPAGHIPGSAQIRVEHQGEVWVFTGDYKLENDGVSEPFELVRCHTFITESTFGLPVYRWKPQQTIMDDINGWWRQNRAEGKVSVIAGYTLGKSQRIIKNIDTTIGNVFLHGSVDNILDIFRAQGMVLPKTQRVTTQHKKQDFEGSLVICPPSAVGSPWIRRFLPYSLGIASGWMSLRGARRRRGADRGFALSDHADWESLNTTVRETGAERVYVTHGYTEIYTQWLREQGLEAHAVKTHYEGELSEMVEGEEKTNPDPIEEQENTGGTTA